MKPMNTNEHNIRHLQLLAAQYPSRQAVSTALIKLEAQLNLPKGTEHFLSDVHGEYEAFCHVLKNGSGSIKRKIAATFAAELSEEEQRILAMLIYYPDKKMPMILKTVADKSAWYRTTLARLIRLAQVASAKYTRTAVRAFLPDQLAEVIEALVYAQDQVEEKTAYYHSLVETLIATGSAQDFIIALAELIQHLVIARLHVIGDIYDRGPGAHLIMDALMAYHCVDIQWGNHDILWMGAAAGSDACLANVVRICLRYANLDTLEHGYGVSLMPLASFALETYGDDPCERFRPKVSSESDLSEQECSLIAKMHKAISIMQFKLEGQIIQRRPQYDMEDRLLLEAIDYDQGTIGLNGTDYPLLDASLPTIDPRQPYQLTGQERSVIEKLRFAFTTSKELQQHVRFLFSKGSIYLVHNGNLLYHGCVAMDHDGSFRAFKVSGEAFAGKAFLDRVDRLARQAYFTTDNPEQKQYGMDAIWYLWCGKQSPLFGKEKMATFERYFLADSATHHEERNAYYTFRDQEAAARKILEEFGVNPDTGYIINGHVPVKVRKGERPVKGNGKLLVIDGGFSRAYQKQTGIAGYTLVSNSHELLLTAHCPFESAQKAIEEEVDMESATELLVSHPARMYVRDTDRGQELQQQIDDLQSLLHAYRTGLIKEQ